MTAVWKKHESTLVGMMTRTMLGYSVERFHQNRSDPSLIRIDFYSFRAA
jgi:hypothetical protein